MIEGIGHVAFVVRDMAQSLQFYCDILGFTAAFELLDDDGNPRIQYVKVADGQFIELFYGPSSAAKAQTPEIGYKHLCLTVTDVNEISAELEKKGATLDSGPKQGKSGNWQCWVTDPDGNRIELMQVSPDSIQAHSQA